MAAAVPPVAPTVPTDPVDSCVVHVEGGAALGSDPAGIACDLSARGVNVGLMYPVAAGTVLTIDKAGPTGCSHARPLRARVMRAVPLEFIWLHACEMLDPLDDEELARWRGN